MEARWIPRRRPAGTSHSGMGQVSVVPEGSDDLDRVMAVLPQASIVVLPSGLVGRASDSARALGLASGDRVTVPALVKLARKVATDGQSRERAISTKRPPLGRANLELQVRAAALADGSVLLIVEDRSHEGRIDAMRRDFVANVSHELKTPVGALSLLAEAVSAASDDPEAVQKFSGRMLLEAARLSELVKDIVDLSRLESDDPLAPSQLVRVDDVVAASTDAMRTAAAAKDIDIVTGPVSRLQVYGREQQLLTALRNLLANALAYSPPHTKVAVAVRNRKGIVEISVKDQGIGIPEDEVERIFERFYRVDDARSRATGGTGLGLAIVKHICVGHGGECIVWSAVGEGSTFTMRIPAADATSHVSGKAPGEDEE